MAGCQENFGKSGWQRRPGIAMRCSPSRIPPPISPPISPSSRAFFGGWGGYNGSLLFFRERLTMFRGSMTALVTPFRDGAFDLAGFEKQIEFQAKGGTQGIIPVGTTGESPTLSHEEHH